MSGLFEEIRIGIRNFIDGTQICLKFEPAKSFTKALNYNYIKRSQNLLE